MTTNADNDRDLWRRAARRPKDADPIEPTALAAWLDGRAVPEEAERIERALAADPALLDEVVELRALLAETAEAAEAPAALREAALALRPAAAKEARTARVFFLPRAAWHAAAAAVVILAVAPVAYRLGRFTGGRTEGPVVPREVQSILTQEDAVPDVADVLTPSRKREGVS